jgi:hypothetical protein
MGRRRAFCRVYFRHRQILGVWPCREYEVIVRRRATRYLVPTLPGLVDGSRIRHAATVVQLVRSTSVFVPSPLGELPTTKHVALTQETAASRPSGFGPRIVVQLLPSHCEASAPPIARQLVVLVQDTEPPGAGVIFTHVVPFHCRDSLPTATQNVAPTHDTPVRSIGGVLTLLAKPTTSDQLLPFQWAWRF